ncbi:MAG: single-stranded-DNA-specific exonuclease RecJ [Thermoflavifilum sp.]|nr:single-stranded-DNA-specific exonuclease RecJ [Thermoflavifilum sp.]
MVHQLLPKRWVFKPKLSPHASLADLFRLQQSLQIRMLWCRLLAQRGITTYEEVYRFFRPSFAHLHDPFLMPNMQWVSQRIWQAIDQREIIWIFGDYDVDGTTAVAILYDFLQRLDAKVFFDIPDRLSEGYGLSLLAVERAKAHHAQVLITLDCGMKDFEAIQAARAAGMDVIIVDHHLPGENLPNANGILNPLLDDASGLSYPYRDLSACAITFKLIQALHNSRPSNICIQAYLDRVALSIAADIVPLTGENRTLLCLGLEQINQQPSPGLQALIEVSGLAAKGKPLIGMRELGFILAPRVNAAGRISDAHTAVHLFTAHDSQLALTLAQELHMRNAQRIENDRSISQEAKEWLDTHPEEKQRHTIVVYQPHWHKGVIGIVASRLVEWYYKPTIVLTAAEDKIAGSARSVPGFNLYRAIEACGSLLERYGGHDYAAGLLLHPSRLEAFRQKFESVVASTITPDALKPTIYIDEELVPNDITPAFIRMLKQFEPFGMGNEAPIFCMRHIDTISCVQVMSDQHLKFQIIRPSLPPLEVVGFQMADCFELFRSSKPKDICFVVEENSWNGQTQLQLRLLDIRISHD